MVSVEFGATVETPKATRLQRRKVFTIGYRDHDGLETTRHISVRAIKPSGEDGCPMLLADCDDHPRYFRIDRVFSVITDDGVHQQDLAAFWQREFGISF